MLQMRKFLNIQKKKTNSKGSVDNAPVSDNESTAKSLQTEASHNASTQEVDASVTDQKESVPNAQVLTSSPDIVWQPKQSADKKDFPTSLDQRSRSASIGRISCLWQAAYDELREDDCHLVARFDEKASNYLANLDGAGPLASGFLEKQAQLDQIIGTWGKATEATLEKMENGSNYREVLEHLRSIVQATCAQFQDTVIIWTALCLAIQDEIASVSPSKIASDIIIFLVPKIEFYNTLSYLLSDGFYCSASGGKDHDLLRKRLVHLHKIALLNAFSALCSREDSMASSGILDIEMAETALFRMGSGSMIQELRSLLQRDLSYDQSLSPDSEEDLRLEITDEEDEPITSIKSQAVESCNRSDEGSEAVVDDKEEGEILNHGIPDTTHDATSYSRNELWVIPPLTIRPMQKCRENSLKFLCDQLLQSPEFQRLLSWDEQSPQVLHAYVAEGSGKTMTMLAIEHGHSKMNSFPGTNLAYFFCGSGEINSENPNVIVKSLMHQLIKQQPDLKSHLTHHLQVIRRDDLNDFDDYFAASIVLHHMVKNLQLQTYFILDGLDQMDEHSKQDLMRLVTSTAHMSSNIKWLLVLDKRSYEQALQDRELGELRYSSLGSPFDYIAPAVVRTFISMLFKETFDHISYDVDIESSIIDELVTKSDGNLLWVELVCKILSIEDFWNVPDALEVLPSGLPSLYEHMRDKIDRLPWKNGDYCKKVLKIMATAYGSLSLYDISVITDIPAKVDLPTLVKSCFPFLELRNEELSFTSASAKLFIQQDASLVKASHAFMTTRCLSALVETFSLDNDMSPAYDRMPSNRSSQSMRYCAVYWMKHLSEVHSIEDDLDTRTAVVKFVQHYLVYWVELLVAEDSLIEALVYARRLEDNMRQKLHGVSVKAKLLPAVRSLYQHLCSQSLINRRGFKSEQPIFFSQDQQIVNQQLHRYGFPKLLSSPAQPDATFIHSLQGHSDYVRSCTFSPDGQLVATASDDSTICVWDCTTGKLQQKISEFQDWVYIVAFSPALLLAATDGYRIGVWDIATGSLCQMLGPKSDTESDATIADISFSSNGKMLAAAIGDSITIWDVPASPWPQKEWKSRQLEFQSGLVEFSRQELFLLTTGVTEAIMWKYQNDEFQKHRSFQIDSVVHTSTVAPTGKFAAFATNDGIQIWDVEQNIIVGTMSQSTSIRSLAFSFEDLFAATEESHVRIWRRPWENSWRDEPCQVLSHRRNIYSVIFSPVGSFVATSSSDATVRIWDHGSPADAQSMSHPTSAVAHSQAINFVTCSPNGKLIASTANDSTICIWDGENGDLKLRMELFNDDHDQDEGRLLWLEFSRDGKSLLLSDVAGTVRILSIMETDAQHTLKAEEKERLLGHEDWVRQAKFSPGGDQVVSCSDDNTVRIWDIRSDENERQPVKILRDHVDYVNCVAFSSDGLLIASGSDDMSVIIWDVVRGTKRQRLNGHSARILAVAFNFNDTSVISASTDKIMKAWSVDRGDKLDCPGLPMAIRTLDAQQNYLLTEFNALRLPDENAEIWPPLECPYEIDPSTWWIRWKGKRIMLLPDSFQAARDDYMDITTRVQGSRVVVGCSTGRILLLRFGEGPPQDQ
ncbi:hypothetical protein N7451_004135 [Penicillium sp. IBT 35674x]|nr:hypothetical protein N7451_004135 [Penicillium sp. IBT 35674x]